MQYQRLTEDSTMIVNAAGESHLVSPSLDTNTIVRKLRKSLLFLLAVQWIFSVVLCFIDASLLIRHGDESHRQGIRSLAPILISFMYYTCAFIAVYLYHRIGIYLFAWLGILQYLSLCFEVIGHTVLMIKHRQHDNDGTIAARLVMVITVISFTEAVLMVLTMKMTFKMLRLMKNFRRDVLEQV